MRTGGSRFTRRRCTGSNRWRIGAPAARSRFHACEARHAVLCAFGARIFRAARGLSRVQYCSDKARTSPALFKVAEAELTAEPGDLERAVGERHAFSVGIAGEA